MTTAVDAVMSAQEAKVAALAVADAADDKLRAAVAVLADLGESQESIAELTDVPLADVRAARRPKRSAEEPDGEQSEPSRKRVRQEPLDTLRESAHERLTREGKVDEDTVTVDDVTPGEQADATGAAA